MSLKQFIEDVPVLKIPVNHIEVKDFGTNYSSGNEYIWMGKDLANMHLLCRDDKIGRTRFKWVSLFNDCICSREYKTPEEAVRDKVGGVHPVYCGHWADLERFITARI